MYRLQFRPAFCFLALFLLALQPISLTTQSNVQKGFSLLADDPADDWINEFINNNLDLDSVDSNDSDLTNDMTVDDYIDYYVNWLFFIETDTTYENFLLLFGMDLEADSTLIGGDRLGTDSSSLDGLSSEEIDLLYSLGIL